MQPQANSSQQSNPIYSDQCWYLPHGKRTLLALRSGTVKIYHGVYIVFDTETGEEVRRVLLTSDLRFRWTVGPVVQIKHVNGKRIGVLDNDSSLLFGGPLNVLLRGTLSTKQRAREFERICKQAAGQPSLPKPYSEKTQVNIMITRTDGTWSAYGSTHGMNLKPVSNQQSLDMICQEYNDLMQNADTLSGSRIIQYSIYPWERSHTNGPVLQVVAIMNGYEARDARVGGQVIVGKSLDELVANIANNGPDNNSVMLQMSVTATNLKANIPTA